LGITNFRVIEKAARALVLAGDVLNEFDPEVSDHAASAIAVLGWSLYRAEGAPPISFLRGLSEYRRSRVIADISGGDVPEVSNDEAKWHSILETYLFDHMDDFDGALLQVMEFGYCDPEVLRPAASAKEKEILKARAQVSLKKAWSMYHASFDDNLPEIVARFRAALDEYGGSIRVTDLFQVAQLFWGMGLEVEGKSIISAYSDRLNGAPLEYDEDNFARYIKNDGLRQFIQDTFGDGTVAVSVDTMSMFRALEVGSWNDDRVDKLGALSLEDYVTAFHSLNGEELTEVGRACLQWRNVSNPTEGMKAVQEKAEAALKYIGEENALNRSRLAKFGFDS
jgi:hypothetical protein